MFRTLIKIRDGVNISLCFAIKACFLVEPFHETTRANFQPFHEMAEIFSRFMKRLSASVISRNG